MTNLFSLGIHGKNTKNSTWGIAIGLAATLSHFGTIGATPYICHRAAKQFYILEPWVDNPNFIGGKSETEETRSP